MKLLSSSLFFCVLCCFVAITIAATALVCLAQSTPSSSFTFSSTSKWIQAPTSGSTQPPNLFRSPGFTLTTDSNSAFLYVSGLGFSSVTVNGRAVNEYKTFNEPKFEPGLTDFNKQALFVQYDVAELLHWNGEGQNVVGVQLGHGWMMPQGFNMQPRLRAELVINGKSVLVSEPEAWVCASGSIVEDNIYNGETWNASLEVPGWDSGNVPPTSYRCNTDKVNWIKTVEVANYNPKMVLRNFPSMSLVNVIPPQTLWFPDNKTLVVDFGSDVSGFARFNIKGTTGTVTARYGEILNHYVPGQSQYVYFDNLRTAKATDQYTLPTCNKASSGIYTYQPTFTYHGFRFVQITATGDVDLQFISANIEALQIHTNMQLISDYSSSTKIFNEIHSRVLGAQGNNFMSYSTNCNQRDERLGVDADTWLSASAAWHNWQDIHAFYENHVSVIASDQSTDDGALSDINPAVVAGNYTGYIADPAWGLVLPYLSSLHFAETMNQQELEQYYPATVEWAALLIAIQAKNGIDNITPRFGDVAPPPPAKQVTNGFAAAWAFIFTLQEMATMSAALNNVTQFQYYTNVMDVLVVDSFISRFYDAYHQNFDIEGSQQSTWALPITLPKVITQAEIASNNDKNVRLNLLKQIEAATYHFNTGVLGLRFLFEETSKELYRPDLASQMLLQTEYPSYAYEWLNDIETPTTTNLWEVWNAPQEGPTSNSRDHHRTSSVDTFLFENVNGFQSAKTVVHRTAKKRMSAVVNAHRAAVKDIRALHEKYGKYNTLVFDASTSSYEIPSLHTSRVVRKLQDGRQVSFSWRKEGGDSRCYQFIRGSNDNSAEKVILDCGVDGGNIVEIDSLFITGSVQGPNCDSFFPLTTQNRSSSSSTEHKLHEMNLLQEVKKRCIGNRGCRLPSNMMKWWNEKLHKRTDSLFVRGRCSAPRKITVEIETSSSSSSVSSSPFELFVPTFGLHKPSVRVVIAADDKNNNIKIERRSDIVAAHPLIKSVVARGGMHSVTSPAVALVEGTLKGNQKLTVVVSASSSTSTSTSNLLHSLRASSSSSSSTLISLGGSCKSSSSPNAIILKADRIDSQLIHDKCKNNNNNKISITRLLHEIETSCVGKSSCDLDVVKNQLLMSMNNKNSEKKISSSCLEAISHSVTLTCGEKGEFYYTEEDVQNGHN